jgi:hypothetical protein
MSELRDKIRGQIREAKDLRRETVEIPEWGVTLEVQSLTTMQRSELFEGARGAGDRVDSRILFPSLVIATSMVPGTDEPVFDSGDMDWLNTKSAGATGRVATLALKLSGLSDEEVKEIKKG